MYVNVMQQQPIAIIIFFDAHSNGIFLLDGVLGKLELNLRAQ